MEEKPSLGSAMQIRDLIGIVLLALLWGPTFLLTKIIVEEIHPITLAFLRCALGSLSLAGLLLYQKAEIRPLLKHWKAFATAGILGNALPFVFCCWGEVYLDSSTAGIFEGTIPIFTLFFTYLFSPETKLTKGQVYGVALGFIGLLFIFSPGISSEGSFFTFNDELLGKFLLLLMACSFAASFVYTKKACSTFPALPSVFLQLFFATIFLAPTLFFIGKQTLLAVPSTQIILMTLWLGSIGTATSWWLYYKLIQRVTAAELSLATYLCPIVAIALGMIFLGEELTWNLYLGTAMIILALGLGTGNVSKEVAEKA
jgi:drug/metabolite transporter (DMT)-like permease